jgi:hypothetical protein
LKGLSNNILLTGVTWGKKERERERERGNCALAHPATKKTNGGGNRKYSKDEKASSCHQSNRTLIFLILHLSSSFLQEHVVPI